jgi:hypothetical protein
MIAQARTDKFKYWRALRVATRLLAFREQSRFETRPILTRGILESESQPRFALTKRPETQLAPVRQTLEGVSARNRPFPPNWPECSGPAIARASPNDHFHVGTSGYFCSFQPSHSPSETFSQQAIVVDGVLSSQLPPDHKPARPRSVRLAGLKACTSRAHRKDRSEPKGLLAVSSYRS